MPTNPCGHRPKNSNNSGRYELSRILNGIERIYDTEDPDEYASLLWAGIDSFWKQHTKLPYYRNIRL